jgi:Ser/Thr protein kinase RdoA (MazF antagonist)
MAIADVLEERLHGVETHRLHGDFHLGNLLFRDDKIHIVDFDDLATGPAVQDVWLVLPGRDDVTRRQREALLEGYQRVRAFDRRTLNLIEPLRGLRMIHYSAWLARRWHDPIFPRTWPHFASDSYWEQETADLEDLWTYIQAEATPPMAGMSPSADGELTNADFFWDLAEPGPKKPTPA